MDSAEKPEDESMFRTCTAKLRSELDRSAGVKGVVVGVLKSFHDNNIDLPLFLDYMLYSNHPAPSQHRFASAGRLQLHLMLHLPPISSCASPPDMQSPPPTE
jgi:hypothetical protein